MSICLGDGVGGADCQLEPTSPLVQCCIKNEKGYYCPPSCLKNVWMTSQSEEAAFAAWCYDASTEVIQKEMNKLQGAIQWQQQ